MEEDEKNEKTFWMHCRRTVKALTLFFKEEDTEMKIDEMCLFLHKHSMKDGGKYAEKGRMVGYHIGVDPVYISLYMEKLNKFYSVHKRKKNIAALILIL